MNYLDLPISGHIIYMQSPYRIELFPRKKGQKSKLVESAVENGFEFIPRFDSPEGWWRRKGQQLQDWRNCQTERARQVGRGCRDQVWPPDSSGPLRRRGE